MKNFVTFKSIAAFLTSRRSKLLLLCTFSMLSTSMWANETDTRQILKLSEAQRNYMLGEMRSLLAGTQAILSALAKDDMLAISKHASEIGFSMKHKAENPLHKVLPMDFMRLGMSMHKDFDVIAADAITNKDSKHTVEQLSATMGKCIACHETYQIQILNVDSPKQ